VRHHTKFSADRSNRCGDMADFRFFTMAAARHLGISKIRHLVKPFRKYGHFLIVEDGGRPPTFILKLEILTSGPIPSPNVRHRAKFRADRSNRCGHMADFGIFQDGSS